LIKILNDGTISARSLNSKIYVLGGLISQQEFVRVQILKDTRIPQPSGKRKNVAV
jgi:hypothetical protein